MKRTALLLGVHVHQPVGNFIEVIDEAHQRCYGPFLRLLYDYPQFVFSWHISGWLLDVLRQRFPADMTLLRQMVARGQVELFGAGDTEPVLASIPHRDRVGQLNALSDKLQRWAGARPQGAWLTERVWESTVVPALVEAQLRYVIVDDYHFLCTGRAAEELNGYFTTEEGGARLDLFPISEQLRYRLPFAPAPQAVQYLESLAREGDSAAVYFDDIEKFGIWPETYEWVYEKGWLRQFVEGVLASPSVAPTLYRDYHQRSASRGVVYLPTCSYREMNEWSLPAPAAQVYAELERDLRQRDMLERAKPYLRGGIWRNFFSRYPEANWMHKRMLQLSQRLAAVSDAAQRERLTPVLYRSQANDAYWHGLFGGLYLPHLRRAVYQALVELEGELDRIAPRAACEQADIDYDGIEELTIHNQALQMVIALDGSASLREFSSYALKHNFCDSLARRAEHYHQKIVHGRANQAGGEGIASAHDRVAFKHAIEAEDLVEDALPRYSLRERFAGEPLRYTLTHAGERAQFRAALADGSISKTLWLQDASLMLRYVASTAVELQIELNIAMPSCDGMAGRYWLGGHCPGGFGQALAARARELVLEDDVLRGRLRLRASHEFDVRGAAHHTVSQSEAGFEKIMQAAVLTLTVHLEAATACDLALQVEVMGA